MKVLFVGRIDLMDRFGGDTKLIIDLKKCLVSRGIDCKIKSFQKQNIASFDIIHFFGIMRPHDLFPLFLKIQKMKKPIIVTPIHEDLSYLDKYGRIGLEKLVAPFLSNDLRELAKGLLRSISDLRQLKQTLLQLRTSYSRQQKLMLDEALYIFVTSIGEKKMLVDHFRINQSKVRVIPIGIDLKEQRGEKKYFLKKYGIKNIVLSVGRIEPKKNQLLVLEATKNLGLPVLFIGAKSSYHRPYVNLFLKKVKKHPNAKYLGALNRTLVLSAYAAAKVHVLASWFESPGIVNLEAGLNGCNLVITKNGYGKEYFGNLAWYCDPKSPESIRKAILEAYNSPINTKMKAMIKDRYSWDRIIPRIIEIYKQALAN